MVKEENYTVLLLKSLKEKKNTFVLKIDIAYTVVLSVKLR